MSKHQMVSNSAEETKLIGERLASLLEAGDVLTLEGDLGAGKTTFTKGIAKGLGVKRTVNSPTFTIVKEYEGRLPLYHMDVYRLEDSDEDIGFDEYFNGNGVSVVEWAQFIEEYLPTDRLDIRIKYNGDSRILEFLSNGSHFESIINELMS
ncbi:tRNA (adenosine(37)-N6)-threonylcarbamoyltransferase complex ATPase subunit type 1 TsaE [Oceanobacillus caeni]|uniref:tRNA threonylcarbamoyladenosine biosynthesis protein TsaE n=1 Tax=Oceanobacillus caeni TaxID=405946 RepID=A0ABR5MIJ7_9BACI|nr:tRNA (adenosine(37)-N6)-threonylcarbamoyltransferase complex ATPase subunit type 1 TsaE [Oceanobacillus caeni]KKE78963.1 ATP-binding protein [Bacilli bacterium VT-13-104]PZD86113.1 tRNA (adenosine(37)-N6)-threonylcarbamoyltransferase complex ATPase subunit type 1 TsaE [Bacilli bacterium]KPH73864.1 ATP-binding protein [Oceanobacillus caeni]MCR1835588.1 tRNA (adenosine(37)-N6)-threonylcarbamoyltransferase complex ATPase subunit type 1 TsaE [Oceanobacillus caeni]PZD89412.1 tRNA (adenosine(37)-